MKRQLNDGKRLTARMVWGPVNYLAVSAYFRRLKYLAAQRIPRQGPFLLVCNHTSRWDGLIVQKLIGRPANFMVSPNELLGLQGKVLRSMGAFPADARYDLLSYAKQQAGKGEGMVIFPEGDIYQTGTIHRFKSGAARLALGCVQAGIDLPIIPCAISYAQDGSAGVMVGEPVDIQSYLEAARSEDNVAIRSLTIRLHREVCFLRQCLDGEEDRMSLWIMEQATTLGESVAAIRDDSLSQNLHGSGR